MLANASERPRGFPWKKKATVYHATTAMRAILREGFKPRREVGGTNACGGGTDAAISFTLDERVAVAIALGLRTIRGITRGEIGLGDLIIQAQQVAPHVYPQIRKNLELELHAVTPEDVARIDRGLRWFRSTVLGVSGVEVEQITGLISDGTVEVTYQDKYTVEGWVPAQIYAQLRNDHERTVHERLYPDRPFDGYDLKSWEKSGQYRSGIVEAYKTLLHFGGWDGESGHAFYNPLFFGTDLAPLSKLDDQDLGVVSARLSADWLCAEPPGAESLGYELPPVGTAMLHQWSQGCENELDRGRYGEVRGPKTRSEYHSTLPREWDPPDPSDTIALMSSMSELRVWDMKLIDRVDEHFSLVDVLNEARDAWDRKGHVVDEPYWMPYHRDVPRFGWIPE